MASDESRSSGLALRYATAAFELAAEERATDSLAEDLARLKTLVFETPELMRLVRSPLFSREEQTAGMRAVLARIDVNDLARRLVLLLAEKRRLFALVAVIEAYEALIARQRGEVSAEVISARPLSEEEAGELRRVLKEKLGREAKLTARVDPALLGGLIVKVGSRMIDSSLRSKLAALRAAMRGS